MSVLLAGAERRATLAQVEARALAAFRFHRARARGYARPRAGLAEDDRRRHRRDERIAALGWLYLAQMCRREGRAL